MINSTYTNRINIKIEYTKLLEKYAVYKIYHSLKNKKEYQIFYQKLQKDMQPLSYAKEGKYVYLLCDTNTEIIRAYAKNYEIKQLHYAEIKQEKKHIILRLINSLLVMKSSFFQVENLNALYYIVESNKNKVLAIKIDINAALLLSINLTTFIKAKPNESRQHYIINSDKLVKISKPEEGVLSYTKGNYSNKKSSYKFLGLMLNNRNKTLKESKVNVLLKYKRAIALYFGDILTIDFLQTETCLYENGLDSIKRKAELKEKIVKLLTSVELHIANYTGENLEKKLFLLREKILHYVSSETSIEYSNEVVLNKLNLTITKNKEFYENNKIEDPYNLIKSTQCLSQNMSIDILDKILADNKETLLHVLLKELIIKQELFQSKLLLPYTNILDNFIVIYPFKASQKAEYDFYKVEIISQQLNFTGLTTDEKRLCEDICFSISYDTTLEAILIYNHNISYITKSMEFPLPNIIELEKVISEYVQPVKMKKQTILDIWDEIYQLEKHNLRERLLKEIEKNINILDGSVELTLLTLGKDNNKFKLALEEHVNRRLVLSLKTKKENRHIIESLIGIRYSKAHDKYFVGTNHNLNMDIKKASIIRELHTYSGENMMKTILPMLNEYFVKNGDFTVLPYPLKYIKEYYKEQLKYIDTND